MKILLASSLVLLIVIANFCLMKVSQYESKVLKNGEPLINGYNTRDFTPAYLLEFQCSHSENFNIEVPPSCYRLRKNSENHKFLQIDNLTYISLISISFLMLMSLFIIQNGFVSMSAILLQLKLIYSLISANKFKVTYMKFKKLDSHIVIFFILITLIAHSKSIIIPQGFLYGDANIENGRAIVAAPDSSGYIFTGNVVKPEGNVKTFVSRINEDGTTQWNLELGCAYPYDNNVNDIILTNDKQKIIVAGDSRRECFDNFEAKTIPVFYRVSLNGALEHTQFVFMVGSTAHVIKAIDNEWYVVAGSEWTGTRNKGFIGIIHDMGAENGIAVYGDFWEILDIEIADSTNFYAVGTSSSDYGTNVYGIIATIDKTTRAIGLSSKNIYLSNYYSVARSTISNVLVVAGWRDDSGNRIATMSGFDNGLSSVWRFEIDGGTGEQSEFLAVKEMVHGNFAFVGYYNPNTASKLFVLTTTEVGMINQQKADQYRPTSRGYDVAINGEDGTIGVVGETDNGDQATDFYVVNIPGCGEGMVYDKSTDNSCVCRTGYEVVDSSLKCVAENDATKSCKTINACRDRRSSIGICNKICTCTPDYYWDSSAKKCNGFNNGNAYCDIDIDCKVQVPTGNCENNKCVCASGYVYSYSSKLCKFANDNSESCSDISECADSNVNRAECNDKCTCKNQYEYDPVRHICAGYNTGKTVCTVVDECFDFTAQSAECKTGYCACAVKHVFDTIHKKCVCDQGYYSPMPPGYRSCKSCSTGEYQDEIGKSGCKKCPAGTYNSGLTRKSLAYCWACPQHSTSKAGQSQCDCDPGYYYDGTSTKTPGNQYCKPCHNFCKVCVSNPKLCSQCKIIPGVYSSQKQCLCDIMNGYYINHITDINEECLRCPKYCSRCDSSTKCLVCEDNGGLIMNYLTNVCECKAVGYYERINPKSTNFYKEECVQCDPLCKFCDPADLSKCLECDITKGAINIEPYKCGCQPHFFYDPNSDKCAECDSLCDSCHGFGNDNCDTCNKNIGFVVDSKTDLCLQNCYSIDGFFHNNTQCSKCHENCLNCYGNDLNQCTHCTNSTLLVYNGACVVECPAHYFANEDNICFECHETCGNCTKSGINGCSSCPSNKYLNENSCVDSCPDSSYLDSVSFKCIPCKNPCEKCINENECLTCARGFYLYNSENNNAKCVTSENCGLYRYGNDDTQKCEDCHFSCLTCTGPSNTECVECNFIKGYGRTNDYQSRECILQACEIGTFLYTDYERKSATCVKCHESCLNCIGPEKSDCLECKPGFKIISDFQNRVKCLSCNEINPGFNLGSDGKCHEKCGDGKNLGEFECDDGNLLNEDGCNHECQIEYGFKCIKSNSAPDFCYDYLSPTAKLSVIKPNILTVEFSEPVKITVDTKSFIENWTNITIDFSEEPCNLQKFSDKYIPANSSITFLQINLHLECSLQGGLEKYNLTFNGVDKITDLYGNTLSTKNLHANTLRFLYISDAQKASIEATGAAFSVSTFMTFGLVITMSMLQSTAIGSFWTFVNMIQLASYIPILKCKIPYNLQVFFTQYMSVSKVVFPLKLLPDFILNPLNILKAFITESIGENFEICGYETFSFLWNFGEELITWILLGMFYILLKILDIILPSGKCEMIRQWKKDYEFNNVIRILIECYMNLVFCSFLNIWISHATNFANKISLTASIIAAMLSTGFLVISLRLVETRRKERRKKDFIETYGTIIEDLKIGFKKSHFSNRYYYPFFMIRRIFYAVILISLIDHPFIQIGFITSLVISPMIFYLIYCFPFKGNITNYLNIYNEFSLFAVYFGILIINLFDFSPNNQMIVGWILISFILLSLVATWIIMLPGAFKELINYAKEIIFGSEKVPESHPKGVQQIELNCKESEIKNSKIHELNQTSSNLRSNDENLKNDIKNTNSNQLPKITEPKFD